MRTSVAMPVVALLAAGCAAVAVGAGAAAGTYYSDRGVQSIVRASFDRVVGAAERALPELGVRIEKTERKDEVGKRETKIEGKREDGKAVDVTVKQEENAAVDVEVIARRSEVTWDKEFAGSILELILKYSGQ